MKVCALNVCQQSCIHYRLCWKQCSLLGDEASSTSIILPLYLPLAAEFWLHAVKELGYLFVSYLRMKKIQCRHIEKGLIETPLLQKNKCAIYHQLLCLVWSWDWCFLRWYQGGQDTAQAVNVTLAVLAARLGLVGIILILWGVQMQTALGQILISKRLRSTSIVVFTWHLSATPLHSLFGWQNGSRLQTAAWTATWLRTKITCGLWLIDDAASPNI